MKKLDKNEKMIRQRGCDTLKAGKKLGMMRAAVAAAMAGCMLAAARAEGFLSVSGGDIVDSLG